jgi:hypothetical protein
MAGAKAFQKLSSLEAVVPVYSIGRYAGCSFVPSVVLENQQDAQHPKCRRGHSKEIKNQGIQADRIFRKDRHL